MTGAAKRVLLAIRRYRADLRGAAAAEFALTLTFLILPLLSAIDLGVYVYKLMQLENAAQVGAQAAWATCSAAANLPATVGTHCSTLTTKVTQAVQSTPLGTAATVTSTTEGYYCVNTSTNALVLAGPVTSARPANCSGVAGGSASDTPGDYIIITASYTYAPLFSALSIASVLTTPITSTVRMRLG